jgi:phosphoribosylglycinamide formyltransferase-1
MSNSQAKRVLLLASGTGSLARSIMEEVRTGGLPIEIIALLSDKQAPVLELAHSFGVPTIFHPLGQDRSAWNKELLVQVRALNPDLVVSVGFMRILAKEFVEEFAVINTHPSLLPLFPGAHAVRDALAAGATLTGSTVHRVDAGMDTGAIIAQRELAIWPAASEAELHEEIKIIERALIVEVLKKYATEGSL